MDVGCIGVVTIAEYMLGYARAIPWTVKEGKQKKGNTAESVEREDCEVGGRGRGVVYVNR